MAPALNQSCLYAKVPSCLTSMAVRAPKPMVHHTPLLAWLKSELRLSTSKSADG